MPTRAHAPAASTTIEVRISPLSVITLVTVPFSATKPVTVVFGALVLSEEMKASNSSFAAVVENDGVVFEDEGVLLLDT